MWPIIIQESGLICSGPASTRYGALYGEALPYREGGGGVFWSIQKGRENCQFGTSPSKNLLSTHPIPPYRCEIRVFTAAFVLL